MGALPSQKYDTVLESFVRYLIENKTAIGYKHEDISEYWIKDFLKQFDKGEWTI